MATINLPSENTYDRAQHEHASSLMELKPVLRCDLIFQQTDGSAQGQVAVKDPVSNEFFFFSHRDETLLKQFDGRSIRNILAFWNQRFADDPITLMDVVTFVTELAQQGLMLSPRLHRTAKFDDTRLGWQSLRSIRTVMMTVLFFRWRGVNPTGLLQRLYPLAKPLFRPAGRYGIGLLVLLALTTLVLQQERFLYTLQHAEHWLSATSWFHFVLLFIGVKVIHELSHALVAWHFGRRCHEMGVIFCFGVPCLYCDLSEMWLEPNRSKRMLASAAGMLAELVIASLAILAWASSWPGPVQEISFRLILLCSVQTILVNGNPLLRYDGYFLFSDWMRVPNLRSLADQWLSQWWQRWILAGQWRWPRNPEIASGWLAIYAIASKLYRLSLWLVIGYAILRVADGYELKGMGTLMVIFLVVGMIEPIVTSQTSLMKQWISTLPSDGNLWRRCVPPFLALGILLVALFVPLPHSHRSSFFVEPQQEQILHAPYSGRLVPRHELNDISQGHVLFEIDNRSLKRRYEINQIELVNARARLEHAERLRSEQGVGSARIPGLKSAVLSHEAVGTELTKELARCQVRAEIDGHFILPRLSLATYEDTATVMNPLHRSAAIQTPDAFVKEGDWLGSIVADLPPVFVLYISQQDVEWVKRGQQVEFNLSGFSPARALGVVEAIEDTPVSEIPPEVVAQREVQTEIGARERAVEPYYRVRVRVADESVRFVPYRLSGQALIKLPAMSMWSRLYALVFKL